MNSKTLTAKELEGRTCSLCGDTFSNENTAKLILLSKERYKDTDVYAAICANSPYNERHTPDKTSLIVTYHVNDQGFTSHFS